MMLTCYGQYLEVFVRGLLPFLCHRMGHRTGLGPDAEEEGGANQDADSRSEENLASLVRRRQSSRAVGSEGDPVS